MSAVLPVDVGTPAPCGERIRVRGIVQGVGFRPAVWRIARALGVCGSVANDGAGVVIEAWGEPAALDAFVERLHREAPPLARVEAVERSRLDGGHGPGEFRIAASEDSQVSTHIAPDAATCEACAREIVDPFARRFRYPFTNCTHCGPRLTIVTSMPYDRAHTTMARFELCAACAAEYGDPGDRRFHAQPLACHVCGPRLALVRADARPLALDAYTFLDEADAACTLLQRGSILAVQGMGGYQLACDATQAEAVARLRAGKRREAKPFALMARDLDVVRRYCRVSAAEAALLESTAAPIVLLDRAPGGAPPLADAVAPGVAPLGFMLPNAPLHYLMLRRMDRPIVLTSGNLSGEPQAIARDEAHARLEGVAEYFLEHDRGIARRIDDSVARVVAGRPRVTRRSRGYAPAPLPLPPGFEDAPHVLAYGGELKNTFCLARGGVAVLSAHIGDLEDALTRADYRKALADFRAFFGFEPAAAACDLHPDYASTRIAQTEGVPVHVVQHHHAHIAACMAENGVPLDAPPVLGVALDGAGYGEDGTIWGGEFLLADYAGYARMGTFKPVPLLGGEAAVHEPWRSTYAHLVAEMGWPAFAMNYAELEIYRFLEAQPRDVLDAMAKRALNAPLASSCGRLFDAVAAALGYAREHAAYEGQAAMALESAVDRDCLENEDAELDYPFAIPNLKGSALPYVEPLAMWQALLGDLILKTPPGVIAARFHRGLARVIVRMVEQLASQISTPGARLPTVALSGGVFQNRILFERVLSGLDARGFRVLAHERVPCNDGGLALGQAAVVSARLLGARSRT